MTATATALVTATSTALGWTMNSSKIISDLQNCYGYSDQEKHRIMERAAVLIKDMRRALETIAVDVENQNLSGRYCANMYQDIAREVLDKSAGITSDDLRAARDEAYEITEKKEGLK